MFLPSGLEVDWFPQPGMIHFEWYVPVDEQHHMYMITQSRYCNTEEEERQFHEDCETLFEGFLCGACEQFLMWVSVVSAHERHCSEADFS